MIKDILQKNIIAAMKAKDAITLEALKAVKAAVQQVSKDPTDADYLTALNKTIKQYKETAEFAKAGGRMVAVTSAESAIGILEAYLPKSFSLDEARSFAYDIIAKSGLELSKKNMNTLVKMIVAQSAGQTDGKTVSGIVNKLIVATET